MPDDEQSLADLRADITDRYATLVKEQLALIGEDPNREGLLRTPLRVARTRRAW